MTHTIASYILLNAKKVAIVATLAIALIFSASAANAAIVGEGKDCSPASNDSCQTGLDCINDVCTDQGTNANGGTSDTNLDFGLGNDDAASGLGLGDTDLDDAVVDLINVLLGFLGLIAVVIILICGFRWMTAGGNEDKVAEARKTIFAGIIGLAIILFAWGITTFVVEQLGKAIGADNFQNI